MTTDTLTIARRFNGPPDSGNGGYVCGRLAQYVTAPAVSVRLRAPPPLERALCVEAADGEARLLDGDALIGHARGTDLHVDAPPAPPFAEAQVASRSYTGFVRHLLPTCFVCGPQRLAGDGLRIFPGRTREPSVLAAPWTPSEDLAHTSGHVAPEFVWAALDCAGAFAVMPESFVPILLGELTARLDAPIRAGTPCVVVAWPLGVDGRKRYAGTAIYCGASTPAAVAKATWITVDAAKLNTKAG